MLLTKLVHVDTRGRGQEVKQAEMELNKTLMTLQQNGCEVFHDGIRPFHIDTGKALYVVTYNDPRMDGPRNATK